MFDLSPHTCARGGRRLVLAAMLWALPVVAFAQVTGISYTFSPFAERVFWEGDAGLSDGYLLGGELGFGFGEFLELKGTYSVSQGVETDLGGLSVQGGGMQAALDALSGREVDLTRYGGRLRMNISRGGAKPYVSLGTGVLELKPDGLDENRYVYATGGVGLVLSTSDRYTFTLGGEMLGYRYNPAALFSDADLQAAGLQRDDFNQQTVLNPSIRAALEVYVGGRRRGTMTATDRAFQRQFGGGGTRLNVRPFYGQIEFHEDLNLPEKQPLAGVSAGVDLGPYLGVRGFYWKATSENELFEDGLPGGFRDLAFYGGDLHLRFGNGFFGSGLGSLQPSLVLGGGYMDVGEDYAGEAGVVADSRFFASGGANLAFPLIQALRLDLGVRGLFMSTVDANNTANASDVKTSLMYTAGVSFNLGGGNRTEPRAEPIETVVIDEAGDPTFIVTEAAPSAREQALEAQLRAMQVQLDSLNRAMQMANSPRMATPVVRDTVPTTAITRTDGQTITIPLPQNGEIYLRYGADGQTPVYVTPTTGAVTTGNVLPGVVTDSAGGLTAQQIRTLIRQAVREEMQRMQPVSAGASTAELEAIERRLREDAQRDMDRLRDLLVEQQPNTVVVGGGGTVEGPGRRLTALLPYLGYRLGAGPEQFLLGVRADFRTPASSMRLLPELYLGFGNGGNAFGLIGNAAFPFAQGIVGEAAPYGGAGIGLVSEDRLSGLQLALNLLLGAEYPLGFGRVFGEVSTLDFFEQSRIVLGYRIGFGGQ